MKNYVQNGVNLTLSAPANLTAGTATLVGSIFGVAADSALSGEDFTLVTRGVFTLPKVSAQAITVGAKVYYDATAKLVTTVSTSNTLIGVAVSAAANPSATVDVRLNGSFA